MTLAVGVTLSTNTENNISVGADRPTVLMSRIVVHRYGIMFRSLLFSNEMN